MAVIAALAGIDGLRIAEPGEFTRQAFENGKLDLTKAEAIADLVAAETRAQKNAALKQMKGELGQLYDSWRNQLLTVLAHLEAVLDFPDEGLPNNVVKLRLDLTKLADAMANHLNDQQRGERLRTGIRIAILGPPNAGKSSLLNQISRRNVAIVSERAGTTRDVIEVHLDLNGYPVVLVDTAGLCYSCDDIELEGIRRAKIQSSIADLKLLVFDVHDWPNLDHETLDLMDDSTFLILNKIDILHPLYLHRIAGKSVIGVSALTGYGIPQLIEIVTSAVQTRFALNENEEPVLTRCRDSILRALSVEMMELVVEDLRLGIRHLGRITGRVDVEDILDVIFRDFCIGK
jgi:tRNA modification GTPase